MDGLGTWPCSMHNFSPSRRGGLYGREIAYGSHREPTREGQSTRQRLVAHMASKAKQALGHIATAAGAAKMRIGRRAETQRARLVGCQQTPRKRSKVDARRASMADFCQHANLWHRRICDKVSRAVYVDLGHLGEAHDLRDPMVQRLHRERH